MLSFANNFPATTTCFWTLTHLTPIATEKSQAATVGFIFLTPFNLTWKKSWEINFLCHFQYNHGDPKSQILELNPINHLRNPINPLVLQGGFCLPNFFQFSWHFSITSPSLHPGSLDAKSMRRTGGLSDRQNRPGNAGGSASRRARVCCLHTADIAKSGGLDLLVGRDDGNLVVEVWYLFWIFSCVGVFVGWLVVCLLADLFVCLFVCLPASRIDEIMVRCAETATETYEPRSK